MVVTIKKPSIQLSIFSLYKLPYSLGVKSLTTALGPVTSVIGAQWGDEGKGKIVDLLAEHYDIIARACGGANAGHTIVVDGEKHVFHLLPSGCLHDGKQIVLGAGMVIHLPTLLEEIETLKNNGIDILDRLHISHEAHILFDFHKDVDATLEQMRSQETGKAIGTTKRGIGPTYMDKAMRTGIRMASLGDGYREKLMQRVEFVSKAFSVGINIDKEVEQLEAAHNIIGSCITDATRFLHNNLENKTVLIEGAQATLLDIDHGTYPYVTSSSTTIAGALQGLGLPPKCLTSCIGVAKAYCTRVGEGDFVTEVEGETGDRLRDRGGEYGATTGRPRRCGWLNLDDLHYAAALNGFTHWNITKLDVLDEETEVPIWENGSYTNLTGWQSSTAGTTDVNDLPEQAQSFVKHIEDHTNVPASFIGTGPGREEMIVNC